LRPPQAQLEAHLDAIGWDRRLAMARLHGGPSRLSSLFDTGESLRQPPARPVDAVRLSALEHEGLDWFAGRNDLALAVASDRPGVARHLDRCAGSMRKPTFGVATHAQPTILQWAVAVYHN
jgi:hypothetical protein